MFGRSVTLFKMFGFAVRVDASWLIIAVLITWSLAHGTFPHFYPGLSKSEYWLMGFLGALLLFASIVVHDLAHCLGARKSGLQMRGITLFIFGGVAEMDQEPPSAKAEFQMAIAGPVTSVIIGSIFYALAASMRGVWPVAAVGVCSYLGWINWILAAFNMVPAFPLDGGRVLRSALWHWKGNIWQATRIASTIGSGFGMLLMAFGVYRLLVGDIFGAVWWCLIGMFLRGAAQGSYQQLMVQRMLQGEPVRRFMNTNPVTVSPAISLEDLVENYIYRYHYKMFPVVNEWHELLGCITTKEVKEVPRGEPGEVVVRGYNVMKGYLRNADATAEAIVDGWLHTGDLGYIDGDGFLVVTGREKALLISPDGEKYSPEEIEEAIVSSSQVISQVMIYNDHCKYTCALVTLDREAAKRLGREMADPDALLDAIRQELFLFRQKDAYRDRFPTQWLPSVFQILPEQFSEENRMINSSMKLVRFKVLEAHRDTIEYMYTAEGGDIHNDRNRGIALELLRAIPSS